MKRPLPCPDFWLLGRPCVNTKRGTRTMRVPSARAVHPNFPRIRNQRLFCRKLVWTTCLLLRFLSCLFALVLGTGHLGRPRVTSCLSRPSVSSPFYTSSAMGGALRVGKERKGRGWKPHLPGGGKGGGVVCGKRAGRPRSDKGGDAPACWGRELSGGADGCWLLVGDLSPPVRYVGQAFWRVRRAGWPLMSRGAGGLAGRGV